MLALTVIFYAGLRSGHINIWYKYMNAPLPDFKEGIKHHDMFLLSFANNNLHCNYSLFKHLQNFAVHVIVT